MACEGNMPGFKYVTVANLVITHNGVPYPIKIFSTNKKYIVWNIDRPYQLEDTNVRPESSLLEYLIVINDNGKPTIVKHEELLYSFDQTTNGSNLTSSTEYNALKSQVGKNTTKYNLISNTVDDMTQIIGSTEELEDGSIIYNLNKVKSDSKSYGISIGEIQTKIDDKYAEIKPIILNDLVEYLRSVSEYKLSFTNILEDTLITDEELALINTNKTNIAEKSTKLQSTLSNLKVITDSVENTEQSQMVVDIKTKLTTLHNVLISMCDSYLQDSKISGEEKTNIIQKVYELVTYIGTVQNTCSNITVNGQAGVIYSVENELLILKDQTTSSIKSLDRSSDLLKEGLSEVKQTANDITSKVSSAETRLSDAEIRLSSAEEKITDDAIISTVQSTISTAKTDAINSSNSATDLKLKDYATTTSLSTVSQTADKINWIVKSGNSSSDMALTDNALSVISNNINLTGKVSFSSFDSGLTTKINNIQNTTDIVNTNKTNWVNAYSRVNEWAYGSIDGKTTINGGLIEADTIIAKHIAIGDFNNYVVLPPNVIFQGSSGQTNGFEICSIVGSEKYNHENLTNKLYGINGGDKFRVKAMIKSDTVGTRLDITCCWRNANNELITSNSIYTTISTANEWTEINEIISVPSRPSGASYVRFKINIQAEQYRRVYVERFGITRMYTGELIVDGTITADKLSADCIDGKTIKGNTIVGGAIRGSSNFYTSPNASSLEGYAFRIYSDGRLYSESLISTNSITENSFSYMQPNGIIASSERVSSPIHTTGQDSLWLGCKGAGMDYSKYNVVFGQESDSYVYFRPGNNAEVRLGNPSKMWNIIYSVNGVSSSSDRTLKENIQYLATTENSRVIVSESLTENDLYNFVRDDLVTATYNFIGDDKKQIGFIAQDLLYNTDGTDNIIGQFIVNKPNDDQSPLTYNEKIYTNVLAGALRHAILEIEDLKNKINN